MNISLKMSVSNVVRKMPKNTKKHKEKASKSFDFKAFGGDKRDRTADLLNAIQALSQLSYTPMRKVYYSKAHIKMQDFFSKTEKYFTLLFRTT